MSIFKLLCSAVQKGTKNLLRFCRFAEKLKKNVNGKRTDSSSNVRKLKPLSSILFTFDFFYHANVFQNSCKICFYHLKHKFPEDLDWYHFFLWKNRVEDAVLMHYYSAVRQQFDKIYLWNGALQNKLFGRFTHFISQVCHLTPQEGE